MIKKIPAAYFETRWQSFPRCLRFSPSAGSWKAVFQGQGHRRRCGSHSWAGCTAPASRRPQLKRHVSSSCSDCRFEAHQLNILGMKGHTQPHRHPSAHVEKCTSKRPSGVSGIGSQWESLHLKTADTFKTVELCVCLIKHGAESLWRNKRLSSHRRDAAARRATESLEMSPGKEQPEPEGLCNVWVHHACVWSVCLCGMYVCLHVCVYTACVCACVCVPVLGQEGWHSTDPPRYLQAPALRGPLTGRESGSGQEKMMPSCPWTDMCFLFLTCFSWP